MGLDQYAYYCKEKDDRNENREIAYWRKHNRLQGWMKALWEKKKANRTLKDEFIDALDDDPNWNTDVFNGVEVKLTKEDLDQLEQDITNRNLPPTQGFFFGNDSYGYDTKRQEKEDLKFVKKARKMIAKGHEVFYNSSW